ncbi:MAG TPA: hypothetical protein VIT92_06425, partial [Burkholderiaceae bacterium]
MHAPRSRPSAALLFCLTLACLAPGAQASDIDTAIEDAFVQADQHPQRGTAALDALAASTRGRLAEHREVQLARCFLTSYTETGKSLALVETLMAEARSAPDPVYLARLR